MLCWISQRLPTATLWKLPISKLLKGHKEALEGGDILSFEPMGKLQFFFLSEEVVENRLLISFSSSKEIHWPKIDSSSLVEQVTYRT